MRKQTYDKFVMEAGPRERGMSGRFSEAAFTNQHLDETDMLLHIMFPQEVREKKCKSFILWAVVNLLVAAYIVLLIAVFWKSWTLDCVR